MVLPCIRAITCHYAVASPRCRIGGFDSMFLKSEDVLLNVVEWGPRDSPAFLAHGGWVGNWELWQEPFRLMQPRWRCISYDHRGAGSTQATADQIEPQALVDDVIRVLDHLDVRECVLAGESLGALTCMTAALQRPDRIAGLVLVDGTPKGGGADALIDGARSDFPATVRWFVDACVPEPDSEHIRRWGRQILLRAEPEAAARILEVHGEVTPEAGQLTVPTLLIHGEQDAIVPVDAARALASLIPDARLVTLPETGHVPTLTRPDLVVDAIEDWWASRS
jgi:pimeloyl-ACP methyl ester carboxylesterase